MNGRLKLRLTWIRKLVEMGVEVISLADTVGLADPEQVHALTRITDQRISRQ